MEQYEKSGPKVKPKSKENQDLEKSIQDLKTVVEQQDRQIKELERDLRKLRNDMRMAIATFNTINANRQRNG